MLSFLGDMLILAGLYFGFKVLQQAWISTVSLLTDVKDAVSSYVYRRNVWGYATCGVVAVMFGLGAVGWFWTAALLAGFWVFVCV